MLRPAEPKLPSWLPAEEHNRRIAIYQRALERYREIVDEPRPGPGAVWEHGYDGGSVMLCARCVRDPRIKDHYAHLEERPATGVALYVPCDGCEWIAYRIRSLGLQGWRVDVASVGAENRYRVAWAWEIGSYESEADARARYSRTIGTGGMARVVAYDVVQPLPQHAWPIRRRT